ncbi:MAG: hypothetical protein H6672_10350 [Anaerolineaceae bacterium]|nr:hypothetical protein [Anaerolineaceae bacterium]
MNALDITLKLIGTGMLQFGEFQVNHHFDPLRLQLELLPAYPAFLGQITAEIGEHIRNTGAERLVAMPDAIPLGVGVSLQTGIPLVYSRGQGEPPAYDLVGAYDSGRRAVVLTNIFAADAALLRLVNSAQQVGLKANAVFGLIDLETGHFPSDIEVISLVSLSAVLDVLKEKTLLPAGQVASVYEWIGRKRLT